MRLAYIISGYKLPRQLVRLVERLQAPNVCFYIHIDARSPPDVFAQFEAPLRGHANVRFLARHPCPYLGFGHVEASLKGIRTILQSETPSDYAILLTGQDYPLRPNDEIEDFFARAAGKSYMQYVAMSDPEVARTWPDALERFRHWHIQRGSRSYYVPADEVYVRPLLSLTGGPVGAILKYCLPKRSPPPGGPAWGGGGYWNLSLACIAYVDEFVRTHPAFMRYFRMLRIPDEHFFQTILLNSPLAPTIESEQLRYIDWSDATGSSPRVLRSEDFDKLAQSTALFARKFDETVDAAILDRIDAERHPGGRTLAVSGAPRMIA